MDASALASAEYWLAVIATAKLVAAFLVAAGVVIEFGGDWLARPYERIIHDAREGEVATLNNETARLGAEAEVARASIAAANERAAVAEKRAAEANLELARMKAPRVLSLENIGQIVAVISRFPGISFDVGMIQGDPEVIKFELQLEECLVTAGWKQIDWVGGDIAFNRPGRPTVGLVTASDVAAGAYPEKADTLGVAASTLVATLNAVGIKAAAETVGEPFINKNRDVMHIVIGRKT